MMVASPMSSTAFAVTKQQESLQPRDGDEVEEAEEEICRILTLGDGNFSFSLALARAMLQQKGRHQKMEQQRQSRKQQQPRRERVKCELVATSFDGQIDLFAKYPEARGILAKLRSLGATVLHNVDATTLDSRVILEPETKALRHGRTRQRKPGEERDMSPGEDSGGFALRDGENEGTEREGAAARCGYRTRHYDHIVFNHPHTGTEDMRRHRSFLGHFFHAVLNASVPAINPAVTTNARETASDARLGTNGGNSHWEGGETNVFSILAPGGAVHVTLAGDQPERWGLREQAARHGFALAHRRRFPAENIDGYMTKRHQTGRSFQRRNLDSVTLSFVWMGQVRSLDQCMLVNGLQDHSPEDSCISLPGEGTGDGGHLNRSVEEIENGWSLDGHDLLRKQGHSQGVNGVNTRKTTVYGIRTLPPWLLPGVAMGVESSERTAKALGNRAEVSSGKPIAGVGAGLPTRAVDTLGIDDQHGVNDSGQTAKTCDSDSSGRTGIDPIVLPEVCALCGKRYKTAQAVRTHTRQQHELGHGGGAASSADGREPRRCPHCDRMFTSGAALDQHLFAKHRGQNVDIKPDWYVGSIYHLDPPRVSSVDGVVEASACCTWAADEVSRDERQRVTTRGRTIDQNCQKASCVSSSDWTQATRGSSNDDQISECSVCGFWFMTPEDAQQHLDNLRPPIEGGVAKFGCVRCAREFGSRRALLQHSNFCGRTTYEAASSKSASSRKPA